MIFNIHHIELQNKKQINDDVKHIKWKL